jgi:hypothetical protein
MPFMQVSGAQTWLGPPSRAGRRVAGVGGELLGVRGFDGPASFCPEQVAAQVGQRGNVPDRYLVPAGWAGVEQAERVGPAEGRQAP